MNAPAQTAAAAMVLAAGRGQRMRPLSDHTPKPLLRVHGQPLIAWHLQALARAGVERVLINTGWLGAQIPAHFGDGFESGDDSGGRLQLLYSREDLDFGGSIETAGGIARALPRLQEPFWLVGGDVFAPDFVFDEAERARFAASNDLAHLWLVPNPAHNRKGDFVCVQGRARPAAKETQEAKGQEQADANQSYTYSTIALLKHALFAPPWCDLPPGNPQGAPAALGPLLFAAAAADRVSASLYTGRWTDVGTPERLQALNA